MSMKKWIITGMAATVFSMAAAQTTEKKKKFDIPGTFLVEVGFTIPRNGPQYFSTNFFGSRTCNLYYQYEWTPLKNLLPQWSLVPGFGFSFEHYSLSSGRALAYGDQSDNTGGTSVGTQQLVMSQRRLDISKSKFMTHYIDIPVEIRYTVNPTDPNRSFKVGAGFRVGYLFDAHTKVIYNDNGTSVKEKLDRDWNLTPLRYGAFLKAGVGNVSIFGYYNLNPLFRSNLGPDKTQMNNMVIGLSFNGF